MTRAFSFRGSTYALFDPVGGNRGEYLLRQVRATWESSLDDSPQRLDRALSAVAAHVGRLVAADAALRGGGVSIAAINVLRTARVHAARLGDAKLFHVRKGDVCDVWSQHADPASLRAPDAIEVLQPAAPGDFWILTSSQLAERVSPRAIGEAARLDAGAGALSTRLMAAAKAAGGGRQLSVLVVRIDADGVPHGDEAGGAN